MRAQCVPGPFFFFLKGLHGYEAKLDSESDYATLSDVPSTLAFDELNFAYLFSCFKIRLFNQGIANSALPIPSSKTLHISHDH